MKAAVYLTDNPFRDVPEELMHLIPGFIDRREAEITELNALLRDSDFQGIQHVGHRLKGTGLGYGFPAVSEIGRYLEESAKNQAADQIRSWIDQLGQLAAHLRAHL
ncbi:MAG: Hpt domain-containing protein [Bdellovibrionales bacterium]|nr:Hpt domain-containing protein [Bdellovibrionales bacterium]